MINIKKTDCSGCHACYNICPKQCIEMRSDNEGFWYPKIDEKQCINCGQCEKVCPILKERPLHPKGKAFACINKNEDIRMQSSSGGVFTLIAGKVLNNNGVVFGAAFDEEFNVHHIEVSDKTDLYKLRGSKYTQSRIGYTYKQAKEYLEQDKTVLFSGTPCQISGLKTFLNKDYDNLITTDIICHGVPSPLVWQKYIQYREKKAASQTQKIFFRQKKYGWKNYSMRFEFADKTKYSETFGKDLFMKAFLSNVCLRPSCYNCHSKSLERESDITLADFWGIEKIAPELFDNKGTSLILVNSDKGSALFESIAHEMQWKEVDFDKAVKHNPSSYQSVTCPAKRKVFMKTIACKSFKKAVSKCLKRNLIKRVFNKLKSTVKKHFS